MLNGLDLFSGYGGVQDALRGLVRPIAYCEIERGAQSILLRRMRKGHIGVAPIWDDVSTLHGHHLIEPIDIITGGFPCQDVSAAGMRRGLEGERSGLFFQVVRLVREFRPTFVYLENVTGLLVRGMDRVCAELAQAGYDHRWGVLSAFDMGACHQRERVWILAANSDRIRGWVESKRLTECSSSPFPWQDGSTWDASDTNGARPQGTLWSESDEQEFARLLRDPRGEVEPTIRRGDDGFADRRDRIRALGNGWCPQTGREAFKRLIGFGGRQ